MRNRFFLLLDIFSCFLSYFLITVIVFPLESVLDIYISNMGIIISMSFVCVMITTLFKIYFIDWLYAGGVEYCMFAVSSLLIMLAGLGISFLVKSPYAYLKVNLAANAGTVICMSGFRIGVRVLHRMMMVSHQGGGKRVLIIGGGKLAITLLRDIWDNSHLEYNVVGLIDDDPAKKKMRICGSMVLGGREDIVRICREKNIEEIIFAIYQIKPEDKTEILDICSQTGCKVMIMPGIEAALHGVDSDKIREIAVEDLLEREPIVLNNQLIEKEIRNHVVLVTGGGGSIGSELCRQIARFSPKQLIVFDIYENNAFDLQNELLYSFADLNITVLIGSVRDKARLEEIFSTYPIDIVFHAAAHKHVPLMEDSPYEAIKNNVFGTYNTATCAKKYGVGKFVLISTDKAVNPTNVMGASKRMCEMVVQAMSQSGDTDFAAVRFGNVLGSNGSVIPLFKKQIDNGGPVTVTHKDITRFFMTIPEAAQLVLQAASYAHGGEIFVLDMGQPVKIYDLAKKMINLSGLRLGKDIDIKITGLRPGEKLYEELLMNEEGLTTTNHNKIFVGQPLDITLERLAEMIETLQQAAQADEDELRVVISSIVPTYQYQRRGKPFGEENTISM